MYGPFWTSRGTSVSPPGFSQPAKPRPPTIMGIEALSTRYASDDSFTVDDLRDLLALRLEQASRTAGDLGPTLLKMSKRVERTTTIGGIDAVLGDLVEMESMGLLFIGN